MTEIKTILIAQLRKLTVCFEQDISRLNDAQHQQSLQLQQLARLVEELSKQLQQ